MWCSVRSAGKLSLLIKQGFGLQTELIFSRSYLLKLEKMELEKRKALGSRRQEPLMVKAKEIQRLTIWDTADKMKLARRHGYLQLIKKEGKVWYNFNKINQVFLKNETNS